MQLHLDLSDVHVCVGEPGSVGFPFAPLAVYLENVDNPMLVSQLPYNGGKRLKLTAVLLLEPPGVEMYCTGFVGRIKPYRVIGLWSNMTCQNLFRHKA